MNNAVKTFLFLFFYPFYKWKYNKIKRQFPKVYSSLETLDILIKEKKSMCRFGDGELNLISGKPIGFQESNKDLAARLKKIISEPTDSCQVAVPDVFNGLSRFKLEAKCFWLYTIVTNWHKWSNFICQRSYLDSLCSRFYMDLENKYDSFIIIERWRKLWEDKNLVIIEGAHTKMGVNSDLFNNTNSIRRILCPVKNAYDSYAKILEVAQNVRKDSLILIALGPTATILAYDLAKLGYQALDTGHLDLEYCWMKMGSKNKVPIAGRYVNEVSNREILEISDWNYESQIICKIE